MVGAGPTGVEMAGAIAELSRHTLKKITATVIPHKLVSFSEGGARVLNAFSEKLSLIAKQNLENLGIEANQ